MERRNLHLYVFALGCASVRPDVQICLTIERKHSSIKTILQKIKTVLLEFFPLPVWIITYCRTTFSEGIQSVTLSMSLAQHGAVNLLNFGFFRVKQQQECRSTLQQMYCTLKSLREMPLYYILSPCWLCALSIGLLSSHICYQLPFIFYHFNLPMHSSTNK